MEASADSYQLPSKCGCGPRKDTSNVLIFLSLALLVGAIILYVTSPKSASGAGTKVPARVMENQKVVEQVTPAEAITLGDVVTDHTGKSTIEVTDQEDPSGKDKVVKFKSDIDGEYYFVSASLPEKKRAANLLAEVHRRSQYLLQAIDEMLDGGERVKAIDGVDVTDNMKRLVKKHYRKRIPFAEYHNPKDKTVGSNSAKGELIEMCLRSKFDTKEWNSPNTLFRVHVHELAHSADKDYREDGDHGPVFNRLMNFLLQTAGNLGIYSCEEYKKSGRKMCGLVLTEEDSHCG